VLSISQATEWGTVYAAEEVRALADLAHEHGLLLHVDGARLANAAVSLGLTLGEASTDLGVDALSFGGTKNGLLAAEAVVFLSEEGAADFPRVRKQGLQLVSKMRFVAAQFVALLEGDLWRRNAEHANAMASRLAGGARGVGPVEIVAPVESNAVFARIPHSWVEPLGRQAAFHVWDARGPVVRWVTSFDTREEDVDGFVARLAALAESVR
jgi:threonine aldolase